MAKDVGEVIGSALGKVARDAAKNVASNARRASKGPLSGGKGVVAGVGLAALAPLAAKGAGKLAKAGVGKPLQKVGGGLKDAVGNAELPSFGGDDDSDGASPHSVGNGRRMPIQQAIDVAVPIKTAYNQWTQFEDWPDFMHRLDQVSQEDETHVSFKTKIWGISKEFKAEILEQRPDDRIKWRVTEGVTHSGVVSFHELSDRLTRVDVDIIVEPGSLIEKAARGMRHVKRAVRADLSRFKAYIELEEEESGAWRGEIDDGDVKRKRSSSSSRRSGSSSSRSKSSPSSRSRSSSSNRGKSSSSSRSKSSPSSRSKSSSSSRKSSSNGSSGSTSARGRSSSSKSGGSRSSNGPRASSSSGRSKSTSSRKKTGSRS
jgi:uncharacterized membrane protein